jgi:phage N-6-adenine-methyltransferase
MAQVRNRKIELPSGELAVPLIQRSPGIFTSLRSDWATPRRIFEALDREFHFTLDACADPANAKCGSFLESDSLNQPWRGTVWMNPPYGRGIGDWLSKAFRTAQSGSATVVALVPARTDTSWWHDYCLKAEIRFLRGRLCFDDMRKRRAPFPSAVVVFRSVRFV